MDSSIYRNQQVLRIFSAQALSQICDRLMVIGVAWLITAYGNAELAPWFIAVGALPHIFLMRWVPKKLQEWGALATVVYADLFRGILLFAILPLFRGTIGVFEIALLFIVNILLNSFGAFFNPAMLILPTRITRDPKLIEQTTAVLETCVSLANVVAPVLSVWGFFLFGLPGLVAINAASYLIAAWIEKGIIEDPARSASDASLAIANNTAESAPAISIGSIHRRDPLLTSLLASFFALNLFLGPVLAFIPLFARFVYHGTLSTVGALETALAAGTLLGSLAAAFLPSRGPKLGIVVSLLAVDCLAYLGFTLSTQALVGLVFLGILGAALAVANVQIITLFQTRSRSEELPTIMAWINLISVASLPLSLAAIGVVLKLAGNSAVAATAIACATSSCIALALLTAALFLGFRKAGSQPISAIVGAP